MFRMHPIMALVIALCCLCARSTARAQTDQGVGPVGACCKDDNICVDGVTPSNCSDVGGYWAGSGSTCIANSCGAGGKCCINGFCGDGFDSFGYCTFGAGGTWAPTCGSAECNPTGACCVPSGNCLDQTQQLCFLNGGTFLSGGTCAASTCNGGCCLPNFGGCVEVSEAGCAAQGGEFNGFGSPCNGFQCPGACCRSTGCTETTPYDCAVGGGGGTFYGGPCASAPPCVSTVGACCFDAGGGCSDGETQIQCENSGGLFLGVGSSCAATPCSMFGACCFSDGGSGTFCQDGYSSGVCAFFGGRFRGAGSTCSPTTCCYADLNQDGTVNTLDLILLLAKFGQTVPASEPADINGDGSVNTLDLIALLAVFGRPCV